jgi:voltage-gated potassium channel Kch
MMKKVTIMDRFRYRFDNFMSRGTIALVAALFAATLCIILTAAAILVFFGLRHDGSTARMGIAEAIWQVTMRTIDTGTVAGDTGWSYRLIGFLVTMGGIFITSALIGVLASGLEQRFSELRRGRSRVLESGHTIILGWSPQVFTIINELAFANRNLSKRSRITNANLGMRRSACVVILADRDKLEMEEEIKIKAPNTQGTRIVCRSGNPLDQDDLEIVNPEAARAIVVLSPGGQYPDLPVAKTLLSLTRDRNLRVRPYHIVAAVQRPANLDIIRMIGGDEAQVFMVDRLISLIIAQTCRQSGLSTVYSELFSFEGAAIYFAEIPDLVSNTYGDALFRFENSTLIGLRSRDGTSRLNPPTDTIIQPGDQVITIAGDDDAFQMSGLTDLNINLESFRDSTTVPVSLDRLLIIGWNRRAPMILEQLSHYASPESQFMVYASYPVEQMMSDCNGANYRPMQVVFEQGNPIDRLSIERLVDSGYPLVMILSPTDTSDIQLADATTMISLIHLRDISRKTGRQLSIVSEIMDVRNRELVEVTSAEDVIISDRLIALALTQMAENKDVAPVFIQLLTANQIEIVIKPIVDYINLESQVNFYTIIAAALRKGETAIGYRLMSEANQAEQSFGVHINPEKSKLITFSDQDQVVVIAKSEYGYTTSE